MGNHFTHMRGTAVLSGSGRQNTGNVLASIWSGDPTVRLMNNEVARIQEPVVLCARSARRSAHAGPVRSNRHPGLQGRCVAGQATLSRLDRGMAFDHRRRSQRRAFSAPRGQYMSCNTREDARGQGFYKWLAGSIARRRACASHRYRRRDLGQSGRHALVQLLPGRRRIQDAFAGRLRMRAALPPTISTRSPPLTPVSRIHCTGSCPPTG